MYVNVNNAKVRLRRQQHAEGFYERYRFSTTTITYIYMRGSMNFRPVWLGDGGVQARLTEKSSDVFFLLHLLCKSSIHFAEGVQKKTIIQL